MGRLKKATIGIYLLLAALPSVFILVNFIRDNQINSFQEFTDIISSDFQLLSSIIVISIIIILVNLSLILAVILYPSTVNNIILKKDKGVLNISKKAIVGIVNANISNANILKDSNVNLKVMKHKIDVEVSGTSSTSVILTEAVADLQSNIEHDLKQFINAPQENININVNVNSVVGEKSSKVI
ncbi:MAG: alkaline shock response membrane anchor protein AmaP [Lactococcus plantarum]|nr:alkaline shock response membrane anchor protein AmaP [Lactococcus plantarum]MDN6084247.1 alkaline shock response membrane anchor protein AmaP [Lactococcus plantarum]